MDGVLLPFGEGSGEHRIVALDAGNLREIVATISGFSALARSRRIGRVALATALADLRRSCDATARVLAQSLLPAAEIVTLATGMTDEARAAVESIAAVARTATDRVTAAVDDATTRGIGARSRLNLERRCDQAAEVLSGVTRAVEVLQLASVGQPLPIAVADLLAVACTTADHPQPTIDLWASGALDALICVAPRVGAHVLAGVVADAALDLDVHTAAIHFEPVDARVVVHVRAAPRDRRGGPTHRLVALPRAPYDRALTALIAASVASPLEPRARVGDPTRMHFPAA